MPAPKPLTATPPPSLDWSRPGTPAATDFGDIYFSVDGGLEETRAVFLNGCNLPDAWQNRARYVIGETGFGTGLNFLAAWQLWDETKPAGGRLHFVSVEKYPMDRDALGRALAAFPDLKNYAEQLTRQWPGRVKGVHRLHFGDVTLTLVHDDIVEGFRNFDGRIDAWFLDGFSPAKNEAMWSPGAMHEIARLSAPGARLATFTVAGHVRQALTEAGFSVEKKDGFGRKRHRLEARFFGDAANTETIVKPIIIGAGIAGASLAKAFERRGISPAVIDPDDGTMASGNAAAIIKPRIDLQDRPESRFFLSAYLYACAQYRETGAVKFAGIDHIPKSDKEYERFEKFILQEALPSDHLTMKDGHIDMKQSLVIDPAIIRNEWLSKTSRIKGRAARIEGKPGEWHVLGDNGQRLATGTHIIFAAGFGVKALGLGDGLGLRYSRGQLTWAESIDGFKRPLTYGGYGIPLGSGVLVGTTHARLTDDDPFALSLENDRSNLEGLSEKLGKPVHQHSRKSRASVRVNTAQTLPLVEEWEPGQWIITGLGSRGFVFAPLLAEDLVSQICGDPRAVTTKQGRAFRRERSPT